MSRPTPSFGWRAASFAALICITASASPASADRETVRHAKSWTYQLQGDMRSTQRSNADVAVVDPDHTGNPNRLKQKANGGKRDVLAYISIGEAEEGRSYMKGGKQSWNTGRTQGWSGNYAAKYWDENWKSIVKQRVNKAIAAGYDGVYLDRIDTYENLKAPNGSSRAEMIKFVKEVAQEARSKRGSAAVVVQNGEELLNDKGYVKAIDGVAKESLYYGVKGKGRRNDEGDIAYSKKMLREAKKEGKAVYVVEYLKGDGQAASRAKAEADRDGFVGNTHASRNLGAGQGDDD